LSPFIRAHEEDPGAQKRPDSWRFNGDQKCDSLYWYMKQQSRLENGGCVAETVRPFNKRPKKDEKALTFWSFCRLASIGRGARTAAH
jgi:hypothetical protein